MEPDLTFPASPLYRFAMAGDKQRDDGRAVVGPDRDDAFDPHGSRRVVADLFARRRWIYWTDFLLTFAVLATAVSVGGWTLSWWTLAMLPLAGVAFYRCAAFIHEIQHFRKGEFRSFVVVWNALFGCVVAAPSVLYERHGLHHSVAKFGTAEDPEYPEIPRPLPAKVVPLGVIPVVRTQLVYIARFTLGTLTRWVRPSLRKRVENGWSELAMDGVHKRGEFTPEDNRRWLPYELLALFYLTAIAVLVVAGLIPWTIVVFALLGLVIANYLNFLRVLVVHSNATLSAARSFRAQIEDSFDHPSTLTPLWGPIGLALHGTHHLYPTMPYHALGRARRRLEGDPDSAEMMSWMKRPALVQSIRRLISPESSPV
jgi:fatty acid desaturase